MSDVLLQNPYEIGVTYIDGKPIEKIESEPMVFSQPDPDRLRPYIAAFLREECVLHPEEVTGDRRTY